MLQKREKSLFGERKRVAFIVRRGLFYSQETKLFPIKNKETMLVRGEGCSKRGGRQRNKIWGFLTSQQGGKEARRWHSPGLHENKKAARFFSNFVFFPVHWHDTADVAYWHGSSNWGLCDHILALVPPYVPRLRPIKSGPYGMIL